MLELQLCGDLSAGDLSEIAEMGHQRATDTGPRQIHGRRKPVCRTLPTRFLLLLLAVLLLSMGESTTCLV